MNSTQVSSQSETTATPSTGVQFRLEVVVIPVADYERAKAFYVGLGWRVDVDLDLDNGYRMMHLTPPGSHVSIVFGTAVTAAQPGSHDGLLLAVDDIDAARDEFVSRGVDVSEVFHDAGGSLGGGFQIGNSGRAPGHDPEGRSYASYASFHDTEGNRWLLQEITERLPGRV
ncbi:MULTISPECIES: VOC family protein [unclassified Kribbella]|uniref:VOC family protein n=1 Tax=unclassified Kribbella TaxID=2644121 RepID=UPI0033DD7846